MSNQRYSTASVEGDAILSVQQLKLREVAELRWDGATELIRGEIPERATMTQSAQLKMHHIHRLE